MVISCNVAGKPGGLKDRQLLPGTHEDMVSTSMVDDGCASLKQRNLPTRCVFFTLCLSDLGNLQLLKHHGLCSALMFHIQIVNLQTEESCNIM